MEKETKVKPALTVEEWERVAGLLVGMADELDAPEGSDDGSRLFDHALKIRHGQPFGFTREDVGNLRKAADAIDGEWNVGPRSEHPLVVALDALTDRIEGLLPPE